MKKNNDLTIQIFEESNCKSNHYLSYMYSLLISLIILIPLFSSCGKSKEKKDEEWKLAQQQIITSISKRFDASFFPDTIYSPTTFYYQNIFSKSSKFILNDFYFDDLEKKDSCYQITFHSGINVTQYFDLQCTEAVVKKLFPEFSEANSTSGYSYDNTFLLVKLFSVKKIKLSINASYEKSEEDKEINAYIEMTPSKSFIFKGNLIDVYVRN